MRNGPYNLIVPSKDYPGKLYRNKYAYEHQVVWWQNTGQLVPPDKLLHHRNEHKRDNAFDNLELKSRPKHAAEHQHDRREADMDVVCGNCGGIFTLIFWKFNARSKVSQSGKLFCTKRCQVLTQQRDIREHNLTKLLEQDDLQP